MTTFGFIGTGHLGSMLVRKFVETGAIKAQEIYVSNRNPEKARQLAIETGARAGDNREVAQRSDVVFICVRPLDIKGLLDELQELLTPEKLIVSVAVDFSLKHLQDLCRARVARAVPSIACEKQSGVTLLALGDSTTALDRSLLFSIFGAIGDPVAVAEDHFELLADLTSCGPGYIAAILREFSLAASWKGIPRDLAEELVKKTLLGTALLLEDRGFEELISCVATKGGITEAGVRVIHAEAPNMFGQLFQATRAKHDLVKKRIEDQEI
jgi:pyrroline-5-carboxylate reductase